MKKYDECYCATCNHKTASECIELKCACCLKADEIRLNHPLIPQSEEERAKAEGEESRNLLDVMNTVYGGPNYG
jgi:hypothetical protein